MVSTLVVGAKSLSGTQFVAGDDFGKLKVYNYPVIKPKVGYYIVLINLFCDITLLQNGSKTRAILMK